MHFQIETTLCLCLYIKNCLKTNIPELVVAQTCNIFVGIIFITTCCLLPAGRTSMASRTSLYWVLPSRATLKVVIIGIEGSNGCEGSQLDDDGIVEDNKCNLLPNCLFIVRGHCKTVNGEPTIYLSLLLHCCLVIFHFLKNGLLYPIIRGNCTSLKVPSINKNKQKKKPLLLNKGDILSLYSQNLSSKKTMVINKLSCPIYHK